MRSPAMTTGLTSGSATGIASTREMLRDFAISYDVTIVAKIAPQMEEEDGVG
jgi:hypothetical protein